MNRTSNKNIAHIGLIVILGVLLVQSAISLFFDSGSTQLTQIDTVFRTAISSIFGFIMSRFVPSQNSQRKTINEDSNRKIGFVKKADKKESTIVSEGEKPAEKAESSIATTPERNLPLSTEESEGNHSKIQVISIISACVFCLVVMIIVRNFSQYVIGNSSTTITIAMYRDIISGSIGALIGLTKGK